MAHPSPTGLLYARFWSKVAVGSPRACWPWTGARQSGGYGVLKVDGHLELAHRLAWTLTQGPIPPRAYVLHHCDRPECVNPHHLFVGTQMDNLADMRVKGRAHSKLTPAIVREIRATAESGAALGRRFGISRQAVRKIRIRASWRHVA